MSDTLLHTTTDSDTVGGDDRGLRWELPSAGRGPGAGWGRPRRFLAGLALAAAAGGVVLAAPPVEVAQAGPVRFDAGATHLTVERFDERGVYSLRYVHGETTDVHVPVRNDGWLTTTVTGLSFDDRSAPMIEPVGDTGVPVALAPGEATTLVLQVRFDNCEYYTERAMDVYGAVTVTSRTLGVSSTATVTLDHELVVRSPMMTTCPDRVSDRGAFLRGG